MLGNGDETRQHQQQQQHTKDPSVSLSTLTPGSVAPSSGPKKRRRVHLNCEECRRTKSRCNRSWPCTECVKKGLAHICPNQVSKISQPKSQTIAELNERVRQLEDVLYRHGLDAEIPAASFPSPEPISNRPLYASTTSTDDNPQSKAWDMTAMLGELTSSTQSKGYAGTEGSAFYLSSPDGADTDAEDGQGRGALSDFPTPWARRGEGDGVGGRGGGGSKYGSGSLMARCRAMLPGKEQAKEMFEHFWEATAWRIQPMSRSYFYNRIIHGVYDSGEGPHHHELAVLFATKAMSELFQPTPGLLYSAQDYHEISYACLVAGKFYTETTTASLISLHLLANFLINSDDRKMVDAIFAIIGMAMRLAVIAGYHRDRPYLDLPREELDQRRRLWYELLAVERVHCLPSLLPGSISPSHYDVSFPSDAHPDGYFVCKWRLGQYMSRVIDCWTNRTAPTSSAIQNIDTGLRRLYHSIPQHLVSKMMPNDAYTISDEARRESDSNGIRHSLDSDSRPNMAPPPQDVSDGSPAGQVEIQQTRLAQHFVMVFFYLHRPSFTQILAKGGDMNSLSVQTMLETCRHMVHLLKTAMSHDHATVSKWFGFAADLFTVLHCPTALVVKTMDQNLASQQMTLLEEGASVIEWIAIVRPSSKNRALAAGTRSLLATARTRYLGFGRIKTETPTLARAGQPLQPQSQPQQRQDQDQRIQGRTASFSELMQTQYPSVSVHGASNNNGNNNGGIGLQSEGGGGWGNEFTQARPLHQNHQQQQRQSYPAPLSSSSQSSSNAFDWSAYQFMQNIGNQGNQPTPLQHQQQHPPLSAMQTLPVGQISPMDMTIPIPMHSPTQSQHPNQSYQQGFSNSNNNNITFGHLPMMPNQMDNWPMSMQNLGGLGADMGTGTGTGNGAGNGTGNMTPAPDPYVPSSEGFDVWLSSILSDSNGNGQGQGGQ